jgi:hypothetical protein
VLRLSEHERLELVVVDPSRAVLVDLGDQVVQVFGSQMLGDGKNRTRISRDILGLAKVSFRAGHDLFLYVHR